MCKERLWLPAPSLRQMRTVQSRLTEHLRNSHYVSYTSSTGGARLTVGSLTVRAPLQPQWRLVMLFAVITCCNFNKPILNWIVSTERCLLSPFTVGPPWYILTNKIYFRTTVTWQEVFVCVQVHVDTAMALWIIGSSSDMFLEQKYFVLQISTRMVGHVLISFFESV